MRPPLSFPDAYLAIVRERPELRGIQGRARADEGRSLRGGALVRYGSPAPVVSHQRVRTRRDCQEARAIPGELSTAVRHAQVQEPG
jgi:hypothetical protein